MLPGNVDPRRPDKVHRYKPPSANANGQGEDLTPDYMNILGQRTTTANASSAASLDAAATTTTTAAEKHEVAAIDPSVAQQQQQQQHRQRSVEMAPPSADPVAEDTSAPNNVIPTSPQYGVAIIQAGNAADLLPAESHVTTATDSIADTTAKQLQQQNEDGKDPHSTPSRNDRFKVVKIASLEPFKRGRWKCMDYVDEAPPPASQQQQNKVPQSQGSMQAPSGGGAVYLQTQSLPQQQIQQMLMQSGYTNGNQFFANVPPQLVQTYFYPPGANMQTQTLPQQLVNASGVPSSMPAQFINASQPYFASAGGFGLPPNYQNLQYVPANLIQNQGSAFVPTSQLPANFQQSQTYAGPNPTNVNQPMVNGHAYAPPTNSDVANSLPTQTAKSVILSGGGTGGGGGQPQQQQQQQQQPVSQPQINQNIQNQIPVVQTTPQSQSVPVIPNQQQQQQYQNFTQQQQQPQQVLITQTIQNLPPQSFDQSQASNVYTNPQFDMNVNSLTVLEGTASSSVGGGVGNGDQPSSISNVDNSNSGGGEAVDNQDNQDPNKAVNAIDNKIEQAMDLVKSHLMYTVREEVEVLKEKIAELMEKIQQLETENNCLRSQIPKGQQMATVAPPPSTSTPSIGQQQAAPSPSAISTATSNSSTTSTSNNPVAGVPSEINLPPQ